MKRLLVVAVLFAASLPTFAGTGEAYAIGFGAGIAFHFIPVLNNKIVMPTAHAIQRATLMTPADRANRKAAKAARKAAKQRHEQP